MLKLILFLVAGLAAAYAAFLVVIFIIQRRLQYFPSHRDASGKGSENFKPFLAKNNEFLGYVNSVKHAKKVLLFFHGNGGEALDREWLSELDPDEQILVVLAEYPGYGAKSGDPTEKKILQSAIQIFDEVRARYALPVVVMGESLGTAVASYLASQREVSGLALIAPFSSARDIASAVFKYVPVSWIMLDKFESSKYLGNVNRPLRIVHGTLDDVIPLKFGKALYDQYPGKDKQLEEIPGYGHNNISGAVVDSPFAHGFRQLVLE